AGTKILALIVDDPDAPDPAAPQRTWVHWVVYAIPADAVVIGEDANANGLPEGAKAGLNDWKRADYGGPCPPIGRHRYFFKLYALDAPLSDLDKPTKADVLAAMKGHVLAETQMVGTYQKGK
ncbi:MAG TPA: YbhB/YbcL family Raf kinase inhibitor-like protein, partial [Planctomycetes bacterium]|nr:YbhB/YbcL family Raf kinase inhibitor-like protein [Planctomycetota bacterium]